MANEQVNVPSLIAILVLSGLVVRYLFFSTPSAAAQQERRQRSGDSALRNREAAVERLQQMFPQVDRRTLLWDLQRTGGNMAASTERILAGRLETPPITFQPPPPPNSRPAQSGRSTPSQQSAAPPEAKPVAPDLITRYNLQDKLESSLPTEESGSNQSGEKGGKAWSSSKEERQTLLQRRRDQMILEARRKMEAKIAAEKEKTGGAAN